MVHKKIKDIQDYFRNKLIDGDYKVLQNDEYKLWLQVDEEFVFILWISNGASHLECTYDINDGGKHVLSFMDLELSDDDKEKIWSKRMSDILKKREEMATKAELEEYKRLQRKFSQKAN